MANIKMICVRFNLDKPLHKKAYDKLKNQSDFSSYSSAIATSVADYFDNQERENRFIEKIIGTIQKHSAGIVPPTVPTVAGNAVEKSEESLSGEIDFDFVGG